MVFIEHQGHRRPARHVPKSVAERAVTGLEAEGFTAEFRYARPIGTGFIVVQLYDNKHSDWQYRGWHTAVCRLYTFRAKASSLHSLLATIIWSYHPRSNGDFDRYCRHITGESTIQFNPDWETVASMKGRSTSQSIAEELLRIFRTEGPGAGHEAKKRDG